MKEEYIVYSKPDCQSCCVAENLLKSNGKDYTKLTLSIDYNITELFAICPAPPRSFPVIIVNGKYLGGLSHLKEHLEASDA